MMRSAIALAGLAASVMAESSSCPLTTTITSSATSKSTVYVSVTSPDSDPLPTVTETPTSYVITGTETVTWPVYEETCTSTTRDIEYTSTVYTGDFTSSSLRPSTSCAPAQSFVYVYPGTTTETYTTYLYATTVTAAAVTLETQTYEYVTDSASTSTIDGYCTSTILSTTATASAAATQALKCAPTNLIGTDGLSHSRSGYRGLPEDGIAWYGKRASGPPGYDREFPTGAHKDASACCQACQEDPKCVAMIFSGTSSTYPSPSVPSCDFYYSSESENENGEGQENCGLGFTIYKGDKQIAQTGSCGYIAETVFANDICPEGMTPGECDKQGIPGRFV